MNVIEDTFPRPSHTIHPAHVDKILCHRVRDGEEQLLVRWRTPDAPPAAAVASWHVILELDRCLPLVQSYIEEQTERWEQAQLPALPENRKRKASRDEGSSTAARGSSEDEAPAMVINGHGQPHVRPAVESTSMIPDRTVYNGTLHKKAGRITARPCRLPEVSVDATLLPTPAMVAAASAASLLDSKRAVRVAFLRKLGSVPDVYLENKIDSTTPPLSFRFIDKYALGQGVHEVPDGMFEGCQQCQPNMGQNVGCEYTQKCGCLEYAAVDEERLLSSNREAHAAYIEQRASGVVETAGLPKRFPYTKPHRDDPSIPQRLQAYYREQRHPIYECNHNCPCGPRCKSRLVQKGRKVPLTIFKTAGGRGWGVYCNEDLVQGQFIDTYLGEVITSAEADAREQSGDADKNSYLYSLDKFAGAPGLTADMCYVVDGQFMGGPTRFINHSCQPNCRQYTVSYNKHDIRLYNLAFFAYRDIPAGTELTFDYMDLDELEEDEAVRRREEALQDPNNRDEVRCRCGTPKCRGFVWVP